MNFVIIITLIVIVYGREIPQASFYPVQQEWYERPYITPPPSDMMNIYNQNRQGNFEHSMPNNYYVKQGQNDNNERRPNLPNVRKQNQGTRTSFTIALAVERYGSNRQSDLHIPRHGFNIDTQYPNRDEINNEGNRNNNHNRRERFNNENIHRGNDFNQESSNDRDNRRIDLSNVNQRNTYGHRVNTNGNQEFNIGNQNRDAQVSRNAFDNNNQNQHTNTLNERHHNHNTNDYPARQPDSMIFDGTGDYSRRKTIEETTHNKHSNNNKNTNRGIINIMSRDQNRHNNDNKELNHNQGGLTTKSYSDQTTKTTLDNEVTANPFHDDAMKENKASNDDVWVWGDDDKVKDITTNTPPTVDDRAAFTGDQCATGMARIAGTCVKID